MISLSLLPMHCTAYLHHDLLHLTRSFFFIIMSLPMKKTIFLFLLVHLIRNFFVQRLGQGTALSRACEKKTRKLSPFGVVEQRQKRDKKIG